VPPLSKPEPPPEPAPESTRKVVSVLPNAVVVVSPATVVVAPSTVVVVAPAAVVVVAPAAVVVGAHRVAPPPVLRHVHAAMPEALEALFMRMFAKVPRFRPSAAEVRAELVAIRVALG
jgi:hypothetical protein